MQIIDYYAIEKNVSFFKSKIGNSKLCAVLKNNAYGHGIIHVARHICPLVDCFAVGSMDEAEQIAYLGKDILLLIPQNDRDMERAIKLNCILTIDSVETLKRVHNVSSRLSCVARVHIKIDSGMTRLGFNYQQLDTLFCELQASTVNVEGIFSHFYGENMLQCDSQYEYFTMCVEMVERYIHRPLIKHIANTSATLLSSKYHLDMVRIGLGLYGYGDSNLTAAKKVIASVISVKRAEKGSVVGYGAKHVCREDTQIATLNVGYATGLPRTIVGSQIKIGGTYFSIVAICMAMTLVDVGNTPIAVGNTATLLGDGVNISNNEVIIYELLCNLK